MKKSLLVKFLLVMVLAISVFAFTGCGSDDEETETGVTVDENEEATEEEVATEEESEEDELQPIEVGPANGVYDYKFADAELRHTFMAAAEQYLLDTQYGGVPITANAGYSLFSGRMQLASEESVPVMGFGLMSSSMGADDSTVEMEDGNPGNEGEYTLRRAYSTNPSQWNHWLQDDSGTSDVMADYLGSIYKFTFNDDYTGFDLVPSMAKDYPTPIDPEVLDTGVTVSRTWQIEIKEGLEWKFNETTDTSMITDTSITAVDFYETYKLALDEEWFRAISGGSDFITSDNSVVNAQAYVDGEAEWEDVGIRLVDDYTLEFEFEQNQSEWTVRYWLSGNGKTPINIEQYNALGDDFGLDHNSIAYTGPYYVEYYEADSVIRYNKNEIYHEADDYFYTALNTAIIEDAEMRFQEFVAGRTDVTGLPTQHFEEYANHPGLKRVPGSTTFRIMINGLETREQQIEEFPESNWVPEPILANQNFKRAMYHAVDRRYLAEDVLRTSQPMMYMYSEAYLVEAESGVPYRDTPQGMEVGDGMSRSTHGYNFEAARAFYEEALDELVAEGHYSDGDTITVEFYFFSGSDSQELMASYLKDAFEEAFESENHDINFVFDIEPKDFPSIYYDYMMIGEFDTAYGGISGSTLDAASFLSQYRSDNDGGFTLNWGIDTNVAEIPVTYTNNDGEYVTEIWSFDAIHRVLNGEVEVRDGMEVVD